MATTLAVGFPIDLTPLPVRLPSFIFVLCYSCRFFHLVNSSTSDFPPFTFLLEMELGRGAIFRNFCTNTLGVGFFIRPIAVTLSPVRHPLFYFGPAIRAVLSTILLTDSYLLLFLTSLCSGSVSRLMVFSFRGFSAPRSFSQLPPARL